jgi:hypothetical protein
VPDDGTDAERDRKPTEDAGGNEVWPVHCSDHRQESKHTYRPEGVTSPEMLDRDGRG